MTTKAKSYLITGVDLDWCAGPVTAPSPRDAIGVAELGPEEVGETFNVYELAKATPVELRSVLSLVAR